MTEMTIKDLKSSVRKIKRLAIKPVWVIGKQFPFIYKAFVITPEMIKSGKKIDWLVKIVKKELTKSEKV